MAIYTGKTSDSTINGHLFTIRNAEFGIDARTPMASSIQRCYELAKIKAGATNVPQSTITTQTNRIKSEAYGDDVRDAFNNGILLCYQSRGIDVPSAQTGILNTVMQAQTGEDLKNGILRSIVKCYQDVSQ